MRAASARRRGERRETQPRNDWRGFGAWNTFGTAFPPFEQHRNPATEHERIGGTDFRALARQRNSNGQKDRFFELRMKSTRRASLKILRAEPRFYAAGHECQRTRAARRGARAREQ